MSKKTNTNKNYLYNLVYEVVALLAPLITTPYVSRVIGAEGIGEYSYTYSNAAYFAYFAALGSTVYARREIAYYQDDREKRTSLFWDIVALRVITTIIAVCLYYIYANSFSDNLITYIQGIYIISVVFDVTWFFQGMENFKAVVLRNIIIKILGIVFIFTCVTCEGDLYIYVLGLAVFPMLGNVILWIELKKYIGKPLLKRIHPFFHLKGSFLLFVPTIAAQVYLLLDKSMLGWFTDTKVENGYYEQAQRIITICWTFVTTYTTVMQPRIAFLFSHDEKSELHYQMRKSFRVIWMISTPIVLGVIATASNIVPWFLGQEYEKVAILLYIFPWIVFFVGLNGAIGSQYLVVTRRHKCYTISIIMGAISNFLLNMLLIPRMYSVGAAIASVIAEGIIAGIQIIYVVYRLKEISMKDIFNASWHYWLSGGVMFGIILWISHYLTATWINSAILIVGGAIIYFLLLFILKDEFVIAGCKKILRFITK